MQRADNRWKGFVLGAVGGAVGVLGMRYYWKGVTALTGEDPRRKEGRFGPEELDSISLVGKHHREGESSTAAIGRILYEQATGQEPSAETKTALSYAVHWAMSMAAGGLYGAVRGRAGIPDIAGGLALGLGLWFLGDEVAQPMLGLTRGPTAYPPELHLHGLAAHLPYGLGTAAATQLLHRII